MQARQEQLLELVEIGRHEQRGQRDSRALRPRNDADQAEHGLERDQSVR